jgi:hypothetical protein
MEKVGFGLPAVMSWTLGIQLQPEMALTGGIRLWPAGMACNVES